MRSYKFNFVTDTSTMCVYDIAALKHRLDDDCDWWSIPEEELLEVNQGNIAFVGVGSDGRYEIELNFSEPSEKLGTAIVISCPSARVFLGAADEVTGDGLEPEGICGGIFVDVTPGAYLLSIKRRKMNDLVCYLVPYSDKPHNLFNDLVRLI